jgi:hypothetical protein
MRRRKLRSLLPVAREANKQPPALRDEAEGILTAPTPSCIIRPLNS